MGMARLFYHRFVCTIEALLGGGGALRMSLAWISKPFVSRIKDSGSYVPVGILWIFSIILNHIIFLMWLNCPGAEFLWWFFIVKSERETCQWYSRFCQFVLNCSKNGKEMCQWNVNAFTVCFCVSQIQPDFCVNSIAVVCTVRVTLDLRVVNTLRINWSDRIIYPGRFSVLCWV